MSCVPFEYVVMLQTKCESQLHALRTQGVAVATPYFFTPALQMEAGGACGWFMGQYDVYLCALHIRPNALHAPGTTLH